MGWEYDLYKIVINLPRDLYNYFKNILKNHQLNKIVKNIDSVENIPQIKDLIIKRRFIGTNPEIIKQIVKDKQKSIIAENSSELELERTLNLLTFEKSLFICKKIKDYSLNLWIATSFFMTGKHLFGKSEKMNFSDLENIIKKSKNINIELNKSEIDGHLSKLEKLSEHGFFKTLFLRIALSSYDLSETHILGIMDSLIKWGEDYNKHKIILGNKILNLPNKQLVVCFISSLSPKDIETIKKDFGKNEYIFASVSPQATENNFLFSDQLSSVYNIPNRVFYESYKDKRWGWGVCFRTWLKEIKPTFTKKEVIPLSMAGIHQLSSRIKEFKDIQIVIKNRQIITYRS